MSGRKIQSETEDKSRSAASSLSTLSSRTIYSQPKRRSDNVVVLKIMDDEGPRPMKNMRPAQKTPTGADQFDAEHQGEYEAREQPSRDKVDRVRTHNNAYPKMYDELNRRKSTAEVQPAAYSANQNLSPPVDFDPNCRICLKLKKKAELDRRRRRSRKRSRHHRSYRVKFKRDTKTKPMKPKKGRRKYRSRSKGFKLSRIRTNKCCQCTNLPIATKSVSTFNDKFLSVAPQDVKSLKMAPSNSSSHKSYDLKSVKSPIRKPSKKSDIDSGYPETNSAATGSSYNSFMSMDHEPMIE